jgi:hypothetical protein
MFEVDGAIEQDREARRPIHLVLKKLARALEEFATYIDNNASGIVNYGVASSMWRTHFDRVCGIDDQPTRRQAVCKEAADAMDPARCPSLSIVGAAESPRRLRELFDAHRDVKPVQNVL